MKVFDKGVMTEPVKPVRLELRRRLLLGLMLFGMAALVLRAIFLQGIDTEFLQKKGDKLLVSSASISAYRGKILDRNNEPLAISAPVESVWVNPQHLKIKKKKLKEKETDQEDYKIKFRRLGRLLGVSDKKITNLLNSSTRRFAYLKRRINPELANQVRELDITGVYFERAFKRYYPAGSVSAHVIGFTDVNDKGQEGLERGYQHLLEGVPGKKRVVRDGKRRIISDIENIKEPVAGQDLILSLDQRVQYLAFIALQDGIKEHKALSGSVIVLDAKNGEVLAAANQPAFNPNQRKNMARGAYRNRAMLDVFEPGSTMKPFVVAGALDGGYVDENIQIETHGYYKVGRNIVRDTHNYKTVSLMQLLKKSSNVAASKVALAMPKDYFWDIYNQLGFGTSANVGFPGEVSGTLPDFRGWNDFEQATLSYGYGLSTSTLQLARSYTALADKGILHSVSLLKREDDFDARRVFTEETVLKVNHMLEQVVAKDGTAPQAKVDGYRVAGKTGTAKKASPGGYAKDKYQAVFVGFAPVSNPRFVIAVMVDEPSAGKYYGGQVAAPIFSKVMAGTLRLYGVLPDKEESMPVLLTSE